MFVSGIKFKNNYSLNPSVKCSFSGINAKVAGPIAFSEIIRGKLYAGNSFNDKEPHLLFLKNSGIKTLLYINTTARDFFSRKDFTFSTVGQNEKKLAEKHGLNFLEFYISEDSVLSFPISETAQQEFKKFISIMEDNVTPKPVYLHCYAGITRTGAVLRHYEKHLLAQGQRNAGFYQYFTKLQEIYRGNY